MMRRSCRSRPLLVGVAAADQRRSIQTRATRDREVLGMPKEHQNYQRMTTRPIKRSGIQFNTHLSSWQVARCRDTVIDWLNWGKETGQAHAPHRNQRVAFDHHDTMQPTSLPHYAEVHGWSEGQDPSGRLRDVERGFKPTGYEFNQPIHANTFLTQRRPYDADIKLPQTWNTNSAVAPFVSMTSALDDVSFGVEEPSDAIGARPGAHRPFKGEQDRKMMTAMAARVAETDASNTVVGAQGRFTRHLYLNRPARDNTIDAQTATDLAFAIQRASTGLRTKMTVLTGAQSGLTDAFCSGLDYEQLAFYRRQEQMLRDAAAQLLKADGDLGATVVSANKKTKKGKAKAAAAAQAGAPSGAIQRKEAECRAQSLIRDADRYSAMIDDTLRAAMSLVWRVFSAQRPLLTLSNGRSQNIGNGLALLSQYASLRDSSELIHDGPGFGATPIGGMTHLLARPETALKYPGVAEYVMLSGHPLYAGDALRLGWTDLFTTIPDMDHHVRSWFDDSEHMHNDAVGWQIGHLLDSCFKMGKGHSTDLERCALSAVRARWVEEVFADQPSVESIMTTLSEVEKLPVTDANNTTDANHNIMAGTLPSVSDGIEKLRSHNLSFSLTPWEAGMPPAEYESIADMFQGYYFGRVGESTSPTWRHEQAERVREWHTTRRSEHAAVRQQRLTPHNRHVFVTVEGCESITANFEHPFVDVDPATGAQLPYQADLEGTSKMLDRLRESIRHRAGLAADREINVFWQMPTLDTARITNDAELLDLLHTDPGVDNPAAPTRLPPIYFVVTRSSLHFSEWAFAVKHQLLLSCPFALKASFALLASVRGDGEATSVASVSQSLAKEFRFLTKAMQRGDFHTVGVPSRQDEDAWTAIKEDSNSVGDAVLPLRPAAAFDDVFEKNAEIDGHTFKIRPRWSPRTIQEVSDVEIAALDRPLDFTADGVTDIHVPTQADMATRVADTVLEIRGYEIVPDLGTGGEKAPAPMASDAHVPTNVDFYQMARHPWKDQATSWRSHGYTEGSEAYFKKKYAEAVAAVHDPAGEGAHQYWVPGNKAGEATAEEPEQRLLQDRFWGAVSDASSTVEQWARDAKARAANGKFDAPLEVPTTEEKVFDDHYYRWFIKSGQSPNPSGVIVPSKSGKAPSE